MPPVILPEPLDDPLGESPEVAPAAPATRAVAEAPPHAFPLGWILKKAAAPIQYRAIHDVAKMIGVRDVTLRLPFSHYPGLRLSIEQSVDGVWNGRMLSLPVEVEGRRQRIGTIPAVHRLLEIGYPVDLPSLSMARRPLFRLLAEDNDPAYLYELAQTSRGVEGRARGRLLLREAAAAALAHLGYEQDPRLRGCANRRMQRVNDFLESPLARDPWVRVGNKWTIAADASPPSVSFLVLLAHMPHYRHEHFAFLERLREYLSRPTERGEPAVQVGGDIVTAPELVLGDPLGGREAGERDLATRLFWLEVVARLGWLDRQDQWRQQFERLADACDRDHVWRPGRGRGAETPTIAPAWAAWNLDGRTDTDALAAEVTTRLGIIARAAGREVVLS
jgi:hypothetical protein